MEIKKIISPSNPEVKYLVSMRKRSVRDESGEFIIEGIRPIERAIMRGVRIKTVYYCPDILVDPYIISQFTSSDTRMVEMSREAFCRAAYREHPEGILVVADKWLTPMSNLPSGKDLLFIVLESVEKPGNLGTILRTADAVGADGVIVCDPVVDIFNPNVVRSSTGALFSVPIFVDSSQNVIDWLHKKEISIIATTPDADKLYWQVDMTRSIAIAMGAEDTGLSQRWLDAADICVKMPMAGLADSLNVGTATAIMAYDSVRQRSLTD